MGFINNTLSFLGGAFGGAFRFLSGSLGGLVNGALHGGMIGGIAFLGAAALLMITAPVLGPMMGGALAPISNMIFGAGATSALVPGVPAFLVNGAIFTGIAGLGYGLFQAVTRGIQNFGNGSVEVPPSPSAPDTPEGQAQEAARGRAQAHNIGNTVGGVLGGLATIAALGAGAVLVSRMVGGGNDASPDGRPDPGARGEVDEPVREI